MKSHELVRKLLTLPDAPVVVVSEGLHRNRVIAPDCAYSIADNFDYPLIEKGEPFIVFVDEDGECL